MIRGRTHGEAMRRRIAEVREQWRASLASRFGVHPDSFIETFLGETRFVDAIRRWTPSLYDEIEGIAVGSGRPLAETLVFQCMDEEWWFGSRRYRRHADAADRCSVVAIRGQRAQPPILAQNMDLPAFLDGGQAVMRIAGGAEPNATVLTICGMIGLCGANDLGVGVAVNTLWQLPVAADGLPVACVARSILAQPNLAQASRWIRAARHASGQHYLIGDPDGFASFEASAASVDSIPWTDSSAAFVHTNHPLTGGEAAPSNPAEENSRGRYRMLYRLVAGRALTVTEVQSALKDQSGAHPISKLATGDDPANVMTFASIVMELARPPAVQVASGPPCSNPYRSTGDRS